MRQAKKSESGVMIKILNLEFLHFKKKVTGIENPKIIPYLTTGQCQVAVTKTLPGRATTTYRRSLQIKNRYQQPKRHFSYPKYQSLLKIF